MTKLFLYLMATMVGFVSPVCLANYHCAVHFFSHQINISIEQLSPQTYQITDLQSRDQTSCQKVKLGTIPQEFLPEGGGTVVLALYCRIGTFPSYYFFDANREGVHAMPHLVEGGTIFSPIRCR